MYILHADCDPLKFPFVSTHWVLVFTQYEEVSVNTSYLFTRLPYHIWLQTALRPVEHG